MMGTQLKRIPAGTIKKTFAYLCLSLAPLSLGSTFARADVVLDWNTIAVNRAVTNKANPFAQARYAAIVQLAVFEAVNSITGDYQPYLGTMTRRPGPPPMQPQSRPPITCLATISRPAVVRPSKRPTPTRCQ